MKVSGIILFAIAFGLLVIPIFASQDIYFLNSGSGSGSNVTQLNDLSDVTLINRLNNQILKYNSTSGQWYNVNATTFSDTTSCNNLGTGKIICAGGNVNLKSLVGSADISITNSSNTITIDYNGTNGEANTASCSIPGSTSTTECIFKDKTGVNLNFYPLFEGTGIALSNNGTHLRITNSGMFCTSTGTGEPICEQSGTGNNINSAIAGDGITINDTTGDLTFTSTCENTGTGEAICEANNNINSLIAGTGITITDTTGDLSIASTVVGDKQVGQLEFITTEEVTKANLSTSYVDVYATTFDQEEQAVIHGVNVTYVRIYVQYDFVGAGTDQCRVVSTTNNANVIWESATFAVDQNSLDSGWVAKPAFLSTDGFSIELQCKSSNGTNDPIVKGYEVFVK